MTAHRHTGAVVIEGADAGEVMVLCKTGPDRPPDEGVQNALLEALRVSCFEVVEPPARMGPQQPRRIMHVRHGAVQLSMTVTWGNDARTPSGVSGMRTYPPDCQRGHWSSMVELLSQPSCPPSSTK